MTIPRPARRGRWWLLAAMLITLAIYWPGLSGGWLFDDYPNIVDNHGVQPVDSSVPSLARAALSSPSSEFKRPLASLSFAANYLASGLHPYGWKLTNLLIHLLNGWLVFWLARALLQAAAPRGMHATGMASHRTANESPPPGTPERTGVVAALIAAGWMLLPINLTAVLYVVQRMESMANGFVLLGLIGYVAGRRRMLAATVPSPVRRGELAAKGLRSWGRFWFKQQRSFILCTASITVPVTLGLLAKETAVMLPLYALLIEWALFRFKQPLYCRPQEGPFENLKGCGEGTEIQPGRATLKTSPALAGHPGSSLEQALFLQEEGSKLPCDWRVIGLLLLVLALPAVAGLTWLLPGLLQPQAWAARDFTLGTRLLSEARIVVDYIGWTLLPTPHALSFYHDDFNISTGLLTPWSTLISILLLVALIALMFWLRPRRPLAALGIALFLGCQLLTGTILPLELIYEHRNYFASFGLLLTIVPLLAAPLASSARDAEEGLPMASLRRALLAGLMLCWAILTAITAYAWGNPLRLAEDLADRAPQSPRAQYELGRTYIIYSHYDPSSPFTALAYAPLERAASLPASSILPQQALIFMNARMQLPLKDTWWDSMIAKLKAHSPGVQDESSLAALTQCAREGHCDLPHDRMSTAFTAALAHPHPNARLLGTYGDYAWNVLDDHVLGERMTAAAVKTSPNEPAYQITLIRMLAAQGRYAEAHEALKQLERLNLGGSLNGNLDELRKLPGMP
jgi:hypothetical protein